MDFLPEEWHDAVHRLNCFEDSSIFWLHPTIVLQGGDCFSVGISKDILLKPQFNLNIIYDPASATLRFQISPEPKSISCRIYTINGQLVYSQSHPLQTVTEIDVSSLPNGMYMLKVDTESGSISKLFPVLY